MGNMCLSFGGIVWFGWKSFSMAKRLPMTFTNETKLLVAWIELPTIKLFTFNQFNQKLVSFESHREHLCTLISFRSAKNSKWKRKFFHFVAAKEHRPTNRCGRRTRHRHTNRIKSFLSLSERAIRITTTVTTYFSICSRSGESVNSIHIFHSDAKDLSPSPSPGPLCTNDKGMQISSSFPVCGKAFHHLFCRIGAQGREGWATEIWIHGPVCACCGVVLWLRRMELGHFANHLNA